MFDMSLFDFEGVPQVKCALWQAKQALRAFFLLGRIGSLGSYFFLTSPSGPISVLMAFSGILSSSCMEASWSSYSCSFSDMASETSPPV